MNGNFVFNLMKHSTMPSNKDTSFPTVVFACMTDTRSSILRSRKNVGMPVHAFSIFRVFRRSITFTRGKGLSASVVLIDTLVSSLLFCIEVLRLLVGSDFIFVLFCLFRLAFTFLSESFGSFTITSLLLFNKR